MDGACEGVGGGAFGEVEVAQIDGDVLLDLYFGYGGRTARIVQNVPAAGVGESGREVLQLAALCQFLVTFDLNGIHVVVVVNALLSIRQFAAGKGYLSFMGIVIPIRSESDGAAIAVACIACAVNLDDAVLNFWGVAIFVGGAR